MGEEFHLERRSTLFFMIEEATSSHQTEFSVVVTPHPLII
jgi:hypothetical protein